MFMFFFISASYIMYGQKIDVKAVEKIFEEYEEICQYDNGNLWGISLNGPLMFVERDSRTIIANTADNYGVLKRMNGVYQGRLPENQGIANTTFNWNGMQWTMVVWPPSDNIFERNQLIFHESFHSVQVKLGISLVNTENPHLDTKEGRIWLQLEWAALLEALLNMKNKESIQDALIFRNYRRSLFQNSDSTENALELLEGIPEYTGIKLSGRDSLETLEYFSDMVEVARNRSSFYRTFPYTSGPLYCYLIERQNIYWRKSIKEIDDLGYYLKNNYSISLPANSKLEAEKRARKYNGEELIAKENELEKEINKKKENIISTYIQGPILSLPVKKPNIEFSPLNMIAIDEMGTYYKTLRIVDVWGILEVEDGAFINKNWSAIHVISSEIVKDDGKISGIGWQLKLNEDWEMIPGDQTGNFHLFDQGK